MPSSPIEVLLPHQPAQAPRPAAVTDGEHHSLFIALAAVPDPRDPRGKRYPLVSMLAVAVCAVLAGAATTVWRLLMRIDADVLSAVLTRWLRARATPLVVAAGLLRSRLRGG